MTEKKKTDKKKTTKDALTKTMPDKLFAKYIQEAMEYFDLRCLPWSEECEDCGEMHDTQEEIREMMSPRMLNDWEQYMAYDLPDTEHMKTLLKATLGEKIDEFVDYSVHNIEFFFGMEKEHYPEFREKKIEKETAKAQLTKDLTKEQWDLFYKAYPVAKSMDEHEAKHNATKTEPIKTEIATNTSTDYELN